MYIIGISGDCEHNSSVCVIKDRELVYAESEERITRVKNDGSFPVNAIQYALGLVPENEEVYIAAAGNQYLAESIIEPQPNVTVFSEKLRSECWFDVHLYGCPLINNYKIFRIEHHLCHARAATVFSKFNDALVLVADGQGDTITVSAWNYENGELHNVWKNYLHQGSLGFLYAAITEYLGFKRLQDEGKVTALAASGTVDPSLLNELQNVSEITFNDEKLPVLRVSESMLNTYNAFQPLCAQHLKEILDNYPASNIAATIQRHTEMLVHEIIVSLHQKFKFNNLLLSGGLFANVSLNHVIAKHPFVAGLDICPPMGDEGTSLGAAAELLYSKKNYDLKASSVYWGHDIDSDDPLVVKKFPSYRFAAIDTHQKIEKCLAYLVKGEPVCVAMGKGEFGPRALGNRSILLRPDDATAQLWLNNRLGRDNLMPFAPCIRDCNIATYTLPLEITSNTDGYMTMRNNVSSEFLAQCPGVVHLDGTARFQVVTEETHWFLWELLKRFELLTGLPALLNTSLNRHGYPIARTLHDVLECASMSRFPVIITETGIIEVENV